VSADHATASARPIAVLVVEDDRGEASSVQSMLERSDAPRFEVVQAASVEEALRMLLERSYDALLLDLTLPEGLGIDALMRAKVAAADAPIVVLGAEPSDEEALQVLRAGAQDYLAKEECNARLLARTISQAVERHRIRSELLAARQREHFAATHDALTGLANRESFLELFRSALAQAERTRKSLALLFIDLDHFKAINDSLGHVAGDQLLKFVADRLSTVTRRSDLVARLAGDEFVLCIRDMSDAHAPAAVAQKLMEILSEPYLLEGNESWITASIGIAVFPVDGADAQELLRNADMAMYRAKMNGRNNFQFCTESMNATASRRLLIRSSLREALAQDRFYLEFQPIRNTRTGRVTAVEALLRWTDPTAREVHPKEFLPIAEDTGLMVPIGQWILRAVCVQGRAWQDQGIAPIRIAVNVSGRQLRQHDLVASVDEILRESGLAPERLEIEITENVLIHGDNYVRRALTDLKEMGIGLALDDFGTGYSALSYLREFPFDRVKLDKSFLEDIAADSETTVIASAIVSLARKLKLGSLAEGVETEDQAAFLSAVGCDEIQGFLISPPLPADEITRLLDREKKHGRAARP
jgi:diguanylate cyclase (GGDEF)-like protein